MELDIIVMTHGNMELSIRCVETLYKHTIAPFHLIVMDDSTPDMNGGTDLTPTWFYRFHNTHDNLTFVHSNTPYQSSIQLLNEAFTHCITPYAALVVNSMVVEPEWDIMVLQMMKVNPKIGVIGLKCLRQGTSLIESAGLAVTLDGSTHSDIGRGQPSHRFSKAYECDTVQWAFVLLRLEAVRGNLGEDIYNGFKGCEEFESNYTIRERGWSIWYCGVGAGYHQTLATRVAKNQDDLLKNLENKEIFAKRWGFWEKYHYMNPNVGEFFPEMKPREKMLKPIMLIDPTGVIHQKVERVFQTTEVKW